MIQFTLLISLVATFISILLFEYKNKSISLVLWAGLFVFFLIPHAVDIFIRSEGYSISTYNKASLFAIFFNLVYLTTRIVLNKSIPTKFTNNSNNPKSSFINSRILKYDLEQHATSLFLKILFCALIISFCFLLYFIKQTFGNFFEFTWIDMFEAKGGIAYNVYSYLFSICLPFLFLTYKYKHYRMFLVAFLIIIIMVFLFRVRTYLIPMTIPFLLAYVYGNKFKINLRNIASVLSGTVIIIYLIFGIGVFRIYGTLETFIADISFSDFNQIAYDLLFSKYGEFGLRNAFYFFIDNNNDFKNFGIGLGYLRLLMLPLPSFLSFGMKPQDFAMDMGYAYDPINSVEGVNSMHPTLYGDCFANFGWIGIIMGIFWALFAIFSDSLTKNMNTKIVRASLFVAFAYAFTLIARGAIYNGVYAVFFIFVTHYLLLYLCKIFINFRMRANAKIGLH